MMNQLYGHYTCNFWSMVKSEHSPHWLSFQFGSSCLNLIPCLLLKILLQSVPIQGTWDKTRWCHAINPYIPSNRCDSIAYSSMACIYRTHGWGVRGPGLEIGTRYHDFCSSVCLLSFILLSRPKKNTKVG